MWELGTPALEIVGRTLAVYFVVLAGLRVFGKRQLGQMGVADLVMILLIANAVQNAMVGSDTSLAGGLIAAVTLLVVNMTLIRAIGRSRLTERLFEGEPTLLVQNGVLLEPAIRREGLTLQEVQTAIREHGVADIREVRIAYLEIDGTISVIPMDSKVLKGRRRVKRVRQFKRGAG